MNKKGFIVFIVLASGVVAAGAGLLIWLLLAPIAPTAGLRELLSKTDDFLARSYLMEAEAAAEGAYRAAASPEDWMRVLKRSYSLALLNHDFGSLKRHALEAFARFPSRPELCRLAVYSCLRDGDASRVISLSRGFQSLPEVQALQAEGLLENTAPPADSALTALPDYARYASLGSEKDPERFLIAGRELGDDRFYLDAALLFMAEGKSGDAAAAGRRYLLKPEFDEPAGLFAYEAGAFEEAITRLQHAAGSAGKRLDLLIVLGDCQLTGPQPERAAGFYEQVLQTDRSYSFVPFLNLAWVSRRQGFDGKTLALIREAAALFPENEKIIAALSVFLFQHGEKAAALRTVDEYLKTHPEQFDARVLKLLFEQDGSSRERLLLRLKDLYFENPRNDRAAAALTAFLLANQDLSGAGAIVTHYREVNGTGENAWLASARGVLAALAGDIQSAAARFTEAIAAEDSWENRYNRAAVCLAAGRIREAQTDLESALIDCESRSGGAESAGKARIHAQLAAVFVNMGNYSRAKGELNAALSLDPTSAEAYRIKKKFEEAKRK